MLLNLSLAREQLLHEQTIRNLKIFKILAEIDRDRYENLAGDLIF
jgi:hypothetical protein